MFATVFAAGAFFSAAVGGSALAAGTGSTNTFSPAQRAEIVEILRQALKEDPTILTDAIESLKTKAEQQKQANALSAVNSHWSELASAPIYAVRGNPYGKVSVIEFYDPRCSYCRAMAPQIDQFLAKHPDIRFVEKIVPVLGSSSVLDTRAIIAASAQGKYDVMRRALMQDTTRPTEDRILEVAKANGLDADRLKADMSSPTTVTAITTNLNQGHDIGLDGTPTFLFGRAVVAPGALTLDQMEGFLAQAKKI
ncbi:DsbA family protein [Swingsia samuiensis]|uniref:DsbA family protein n=2 Tax=Swingsia samuiensis TaxID=1293412 RepID=A0A4Y6UK34_9PROT|nr:DsbA family protein [Swingsia samuiensis]